MRAIAPEFFLIRHGETDWNRDGRLQGQRDISLNAVGRDQAAGAGRALKALLASRGHDPHAVRFISSPLGRARDTMERVRAALDLDPAGYETDDRLKELSFGAWEGRTWPELKAANRALVKARQRDKWSFVPPGGESYADLATRLGPWLATVEAGLVVVTHGGVARALMHLIAATPRADAPDVDIIQGRVLRFARGNFQWI